MQIETIDGCIHCGASRVSGRYTLTASDRERLAKAHAGVTLSPLEILQNIHSHSQLVDLILSRAERAAE